MTSIYEVLNEEGEAINRIIANKEFVDAVYPDRYRLIGPAYEQEQDKEKPE